MNSLQPISLRVLAEKLGGQLSGADVTVSNIAADSRAIGPGGLFIAVPGTVGDGRAFLSNALAHGAIAVCCEGAPIANVPSIIVRSARRAVSRCAAICAGEPAERLASFAITGTNGKTTTNWIIWQLLQRLGHAPVRLGTLGIEGPGISAPESLTTPEPFMLQRALRTAVEHGARTAVLEVSSHALDQCRVDDVPFSVGIFTNLTRDHLDYHRTEQGYFEAKARLAELIVRPPSIFVTNCDDPWGSKLLKMCGTRARSFGRAFGADARISNEHFLPDGSVRFELSLANRTWSLSHPFFGEFNNENVAAALLALSSFGAPMETLIEQLPSLPGVPGRLERIESSRGIVFVDFAHTPDALERVLRAVRPLVREKLRVLFGCGGDRDPGKRPQMGSVAGALSDIVYLTSDNPRSEDPQAIVNDILAGEVGSPIVELDRAAAIERACAELRSGDVLVVAGKGHERYQESYGVRAPFSDQTVVRKFLKSP